MLVDIEGYFIDANEVVALTTTTNNARAERWSEIHLKNKDTFYFFKEIDLKAAAIKINKARLYDELKNTLATCY
jgi:hypothetical protein